METCKLQTERVSCCAVIKAQPSTLDRQTPPTTAPEDEEVHVGLSESRSDSQPSPEEEEEEEGSE